MLNYSTSLLQYLHLNTSSDYETVMIRTSSQLHSQTFTKHLIITSTNVSSQLQQTSHHNFNKLSDKTFIKLFTKLFTKLFIRPSFTTILSQQLYSNMENNTSHLHQQYLFIELFLRNDLIKFIQTLQTFQ